MPQSVKNQVDAKIRKCRQIIKDRFNKDISPAITYDLRGTSGGRAWGSHRIQLNSVLLMENLEKFLETTVPHEFAHNVQSVLYPFDRPHGNGWKSIMRVLGAPANRCHSYDVTNAKVRTNRTTYDYHCKCNTFQLTSNRHNKIKNGKVYWCKKCQHVLAPKGMPTRHLFSKEIPAAVRDVVNIEKLINIPKKVEPTEDTGPVYRAVFNPITCTLENVPV